MRVVVAFGVLFLSACGPPVPSRDPNGFWKGADAGMYFYDWDGGSYWNGKNIYLLQQVYFSLDQDCSTVAMEAGRAKFVQPDRPMGAVEVVAGELKLRLDSTGTWVEEGYRLRYRDAGVVGSVRLSFDAGFDFETDDRAAFRWRADYSDDVNHLQTEGGELWFDRAPYECR